jgi:hypothetical protein
MVVRLLVTGRHLRRSVVKGVLLVVVLFIRLFYFTVPFSFERGFCCSRLLEPLIIIMRHAAYSSAHSKRVGGARDSAFRQADPIPVVEARRRKKL